jgi:segregation and condensation protein A
LNVFTRPEASFEAEAEVLLEVSLFDLLGAFSQVLNRMSPEEKIKEIACEEYTVREKIRYIQDVLREEPVVNFTKIFEKARARLEAVATFLAILELIKMKEIKVRQSGEFGEILVYRKEHETEPVK